VGKPKLREMSASGVRRTASTGQKRDVRNNDDDNGKYQCQGGEKFVKKISLSKVGLAIARAITCDPASWGATKIR